LVSGVVNVFKEEGYTSQDAVAVVKKIFGGVKAGHTGTLDPMARGVLPVCVGYATKIADHLQAGEKTYEAVMRLGVVTDTEDITGNILRTADAIPGEDEIKKILESFTGVYMQTPPMYSAVSVDGKRLYKLARAGVTVARPAREVTLYELRIISYEPPDVKFFARCSKGTYIRTLTADIGERLGCGACMAALTRTRSGIFEAVSAVTLRELKEADNPERFVMPVEDALPYKRIAVTPETDRRLINGNGIRVENLRGAYRPKNCERVFMYDSGGVLRGIYRYDGEGAYLKPAVMFAEGRDGLG